MVLKTRADFGEEFYAVGEYWSVDMPTIENYLREVDYQLDVFDVPLHFKSMQLHMMRQILIWDSFLMTL